MTILFGVLWSTKKCKNTFKNIENTSLIANGQSRIVYKMTQFPKRARAVGGRMRMLQLFFALGFLPGFLLFAFYSSKKFRCLSMQPEARIFALGFLFVMGLSAL